MNTAHAIAVTGATGFFGGHLTTRLLHEGRHVRILARDTEKTKPFADRVTDIAHGDINDYDVLKRLFDGCDTVVHLVSNFRVVKGTPESYQAINVAGTECALNAAAEVGVRRFFHCSTIGVHGESRHLLQRNHRLIRVTCISRPSSRPSSRAGAKCNRAPWRLSLYVRLPNMGPVICAC